MSAEEKMTFEIDTTNISIFIATLALGLTIWQARQTRKHNKLMVRPFLDITEYMREHKNNISDISFELINCGVGPA
ncbi:MAG: hypothetical protein ACR2N8_03955, partial [Parvibaculales bacterium]